MVVISKQLVRFCLGLRNYHIPVGISRSICSQPDILIFPRSPRAFSRQFASTSGSGVKQSVVEEEQHDSNELVGKHTPAGLNYFKSVAEGSKERQVASGRAAKLFWDRFQDPGRNSDEAGSVEVSEILSQEIKIPSKKTGELKSLEQIELNEINWKDIEKDDEEKRPLEPMSEIDPSLEEVESAIKPFSFNLAAYANDSDNIKRLVSFGIEVYKLDQDKDVSQLIMTGDWESRIQPYFDFMNSLKIAPEDYNQVISRHPRFLVENIHSMQTRVTYFESKKFPTEVIGKILTKCPQVFSLTVLHIDKLLGSMQKTFRLTGQEVRDIIASQPNLIVRHQSETVMLRLALINEMGFSQEEVKSMLVAYPKMFRVDRHYISKRFDYLHNVIHIPHELIAKFPQVLRVKTSRIRERHLFLKALKRNQYDPLLPNYVSLDALCLGTDGQFCEKFAKTSIEQFNLFVKTL